MFESSVTAVLWALWVYGILPVFTVLLWLLGIKMAHRTFFDAEQFSQLFLVLQRGGVALLSIFLINLLWIAYNYRFIYRRIGRRRVTSRQNNDRELAAFFHIDEQTLAAAKQHNRIELALAKGAINVVSASTVPEPAAKKNPDEATVIVPKEQKPKAVAISNRALLAKIKALKKLHPAWGYRRIWFFLKFRKGIRVNKKRVYRLMRVHGLIALPKGGAKASHPLQEPEPGTPPPLNLWNINTIKIKLLRWYQSRQDRDT